MIKKTLDPLTIESSYAEYGKAIFWVATGIGLLIFLANVGVAIASYLDRLS